MKNNTERLLALFAKEYDRLYSMQDFTAAAGYYEALDAFDELTNSDEGRAAVGAFNKARGDLLTSDRECVAFMFAYNRLSEREERKTMMNNAISFFQGCSSEEDARRRYLSLAKIYHTDTGAGDLATMQTINDQFAAFLGRSQAAAEAQELPAGVLALPEHLPEVSDAERIAEQFDALMKSLLPLKGIDIELCGCWVWISGDTKSVKEELKAAGCKFSAKKSMWYWRPEEAAQTFRRRRGAGKSMGEIRMKYGSRRISRSDEDAA